MMGITSGTGTSYPSVEPEFTTGFLSGTTLYVAQSLVFWIIVCLLVIT